MYIERLNNIDSIIELQNEFYHQHHMRPFNISNWTVSSEFRSKMEKSFKLINDTSPVDYLYSYSIAEETKNKVLIKLGLDNKLLSKTTCVFFPSNTLSIVNVCNLLQKKKTKKIGILNPAYFSISACLDSYGIDYEKVYLERIENDYSIPLEKILGQDFDAIWITSPVYSTGCYYSKKDIKKIKCLLDKNMLVITDESFCMEGKELLREFGHYENFISIYSPHKSISINSYKFSVVVSNEKYEDFFEQWLDVFCGNLPQTTIVAIHHFISNNYDDCKQTFEMLRSKAAHQVTDLLKEYNNIDIDKCTYGNLIALYVKNLSYEETQQLGFIKQVIDNTHTLYYPGSLNGFPKEWGFSFRINLALHSPEFLAALHHLLDFLNSK